VGARGLQNEAPIKKNARAWIASDEFGQVWIGSDLCAPNAGIASDGFGFLSSKPQITAAVPRSTSDQLR
jgi:hypothetical protein